MLTTCGVNFDAKVGAAGMARSWRQRGAVTQGAYKEMPLAAILARCRRSWLLSLNMQGPEGAGAVDPSMLQMTGWPIRTGFCWDGPGASETGRPLFDVYFRGRWGKPRIRLNNLRRTEYKEGNVWERKSKTAWGWKGGREERRKEGGGREGKREGERDKHTI